MLILNTHNEGQCPVKANGRKLNHFAQLSSGPSYRDHKPAQKTEFSKNNPEAFINPVTKVARDTHSSDTEYLCKVSNDKAQKVDMKIRHPSFKAMVDTGASSIVRTQQ